MHLSTHPVFPNRAAMFRNQRLSKTRCSRRGALTVEVALILPILFTFIFGGLEFINLNMMRNGLENACFEGARRGTLPGATAAAVQAEAQLVIDAIGIKSATITVSPTTITTTTTSITVSISAPIASNLLTTGIFPITATTMTKSCTLRREQTTRYTL